jgi:hypothetical protein
LNILKKYAADNFFDRTWPNFLTLLERGKFSHTAFPGWLLIRSACMTCDEDVTVIKYHGERYQLVPAGPSQMGKNWVIHQCPQPEPEIDWHERADIEQELKSESWPDDPEVRDGDGNIRQGGFNDGHTD